MLFRFRNCLLGEMRREFRVVYFKLVGWVVEENGFDFESIEDRGKGDYIKFFLFYLELIFFKS